MQMILNLDVLNYLKAYTSGAFPLYFDANR